MDLALHLGCFEESIRERMTERELGRWWRYAERRGGLPCARIELALANISRLTAGSDSIAAFIFDRSMRESLMPKPVPDAEAGAAAISAIVGGARVIKLGVNKRAR